VLAREDKKSLRIYQLAVATREIKRYRDVKS
jgi:hypothetical protein